MTEAPIVFVWIGQFPSGYAIESLEFSRKQNPTKNILILLSQDSSVSIRERLEKQGIKLILVNDKENNFNLRINSKNLEYSGDFWLNTSLRFLYLEYLSKSLGIHKFFHAELDNAVFYLDGLDEKFDQYGDGLFVPRDASDRAIASLIYCNRSESIRKLIDLYSSATPPKHDMDALAMYSRDYPDHFFSLPTESYEETKRSWRVVDPAFCGGLFDAAAIGQYMLGVDPIHRRGKPRYNRFINENSQINWDQVSFDTDGEYLFLSPSGKIADKYRLFNLHIHAKNWNAFESLLKNGKILERLKSGKRSIITGQRFIVSGWAYALLTDLKSVVSNRVMGLLKQSIIGLIRFVQSFAIAYNLEERKPRIGVFPYISGDAFLAISDIAFLRNEKSCTDFRTKRLNNKVIFCETGLIASVKDKLTDVGAVIVHNGDASLTEEEISILRKLSCPVFATNTSRQKGFIEPIPIGIENAHHRQNGSLHYYNPLNLASLSLEKKRDMLVSFRVGTNPSDRNRVLAICEKYGFDNERMSLREYRGRLAESRFVICPPGNGIDCHRTWEAMYHKAVPVIEASYHLFGHLDLPIFTVNSYYEIFEMSRDERFSLYQQIMARDYPAIYMDYWIETIFKAHN